MTKFTHKGWFGLCPVYFAGLETGCPAILERHWSLVWLMTFSEWLYALAHWTIHLFDPERELFWPLRVTGELTPPREFDFGND